MKEYRVIGYSPQQWLTKRFVQYVLTAFLCCCHQYSTGTEILPFHNYSIRDGLSANQINTLCQDSKGNLWIGTTEGISVFDGTTFHNYTPDDGLSFSFVNCIIESKLHPGMMYIGTNGGGLSIFEKGRFTSLLFGQNSVSNSINALYEENDGSLLVGTDSTLFRVRDNRITTPPVTLPVSIERIVRTNDGNIWIATNKSIYIYSPAYTLLSFIPINLPGDDYIRSVCYDGASTFWFCTTDGRVFEIRDMKITVERQLGLGPVQFILDDHAGYLWIGTTHGLLKIASSELQSGEPITYLKEHGLPDNFLNSALIDSENDFWFGSYGKGLTRLTNHALRFIYLSALPPAPNNNGSSSDSNHHIWAASEQGVWEIWQSPLQHWSYKFHPIPPPATSTYLSSIDVDRFNRLWIIWGNGHVEWHTIKPVTNSSSILTRLGQLRPDYLTQQTPALCFMVDSKNRLWCSYQKLGISVFDIQTRALLKQFPIKLTHQDISIRAMYEDSRGNVWLGDFSNGLIRMDVRDLENPVQTVITTKNGLSGNEIRAIYEDAQHSIWIGTRYTGLAKLVPDQNFQEYHVEKVYSIKNGLLTNTIWSITQTDDEQLWIGTHSGLQSLDEKSKVPFGYQEDLVGNRITSCGNIPGKFVWATTLEGIYIYEYQNNAIDTSSHPVIIKELSADNKPTNLSESLTFKHNTNNYSIQYIAISLKHGALLQYSYRLLGLETGWHAPTRQREITYASLAPGSYTFEVKSITYDGIESAPAQISFTVIPPFWVRWWFIALCVIALSLMLFGIYRYNVRRLLEIERLRVRIASDLHDDVGSTLTKITVHSELLQSIENKDEMRISIRKIGDMSRELVTTMSDIVWSIDARNDSVGDLLDRMEEFAQEVLLPREIEMKFHHEGLPVHQKLSVDVRQNIYFIFKEAVNNCVKYSGATFVQISIVNTPTEFLMTIEDNGKGLQDKKSGTGHGLRNMRMRAERIQAHFDLLSDTGTKVILRGKGL